MTELKDAANARRAEIANAPAQRTAFDNVRRRADVLRTIGLSPDDPKSHAVVAVADRYGLDPVLGHIAILGNSRLPYVTRDGYLHIAHRSGQLDGIEVGDPHREGAQWVTHASVFRKDMSRPFTYPGSADVSRDNGPEMAIARAERRALKRAFAVTLPREFAEDEWDNRPAPAPQQPVPHTPPGADATPEAAPGGAQVVDVPLPDAEAEDYPADYWDQPAPRKQVVAVLAAMKEHGIEDRSARLKFLTDLLGRPVKSTNDLTLGETETVLIHYRDADQGDVGGEDA